MENKKALLEKLIELDSTTYNIFKVDWNSLMQVVNSIMNICFEEDSHNNIDLVSEFYAIRDCIPDINQTYKACLNFAIMYKTLNNTNE